MKTFDEVWNDHLLEQEDARIKAESAFKDFLAYALYAEEQDERDKLEKAEELLLRPEIRAMQEHFADERRFRKHRRAKRLEYRKHRGHGHWDKDYSNSVLAQIRAKDTSTMKTFCHEQVYAQNIFLAEERAKQAEERRAEEARRAEEERIKNLTPEQKQEKKTIILTALAKLAFPWTCGRKFTTERGIFELVPFRIDEWRDGVTLFRYDHDGKKQAVWELYGEDYPFVMPNFDKAIDRLIEII